ncbi:hypothetical protein FA15DRAFT_667666 [Coprinopsis marcescibilis]|uniref:Uncharacterized protein n=1 Tax=Coprinopsis marcescibilis TaxID=230819 RepID=A0A5C3L0Y8_COPMA|nr:hypothetical protein FA15DRAFT_667666 [Coprinopsis marcescibilis]
MSSLTARQIALPLEIWMRICYLACTDTGTTGRTLPLVSRFMYQASKPHRLRSVAIKGVLQIVSFVRHLEALPERHRQVESLYLTTWVEGTPRLDSDDGPMVQILLDLYRPGTVSRFPGTEDVNDVINSPEELAAHAIFRMLKCVSSTVKILHIYTDFYRDFIFFPLSMDRLEELTFQGPHESMYKPYVDRLLPCPSLRRLKMRDVELGSQGSNTLIPSIAAIAPSLTHLYLELRGVEAWSNTVERRIEQLLHPPKAENGPRFPYTLQKVYIHPGNGIGPGFCGTYRASVSLQTSYMERFCLSDPERIIYFPPTPFNSRSTRLEGEREWLDRVNGGLGTWDCSKRVLRSAYDVLGY